MWEIRKTTAHFVQSIGNLLACGFILFRPIFREVQGSFCPALCTNVSVDILEIVWAPNDVARTDPPATCKQRVRCRYMHDRWQFVNHEELGRHVWDIRVPSIVGQWQSTQPRWRRMCLHLIIITWRWHLLLIFTTLVLHSFGDAINPGEVRIELASNDVVQHEASCHSYWGIRISRIDQHRAILGIKMVSHLTSLRICEFATFCWPRKKCRLQAVWRHLLGDVPREVSFFQNFPQPKGSLRWRHWCSCELVRLVRPWSYGSPSERPAHLMDLPRCQPCSWPGITFNQPSSKTKEETMPSPHLSALTYDAPWPSPQWQCDPCEKTQSPWAWSSRPTLRTSRCRTRCVPQPLLCDSWSGFQRRSPMQKPSQQSAVGLASVWPWWPSGLLLSPCICQKKLTCPSTSSSPLCCVESRPPPWSSKVQMLNTSDSACEWGTRRPWPHQDSMVFVQLKDSIWHKAKVLPTASIKLLSTSPRKHPWKIVSPHLRPPATPQQ